MDFPINKLPPPKYKGQKVQKKIIVKKVHLVKKIDQIVSNEFLTKYFNRKKSTEKTEPPRGQSPPS